jgi:GNAT superfamily N-acetyltransferase
VRIQWPALAATSNIIWNYEHPKEPVSLWPVHFLLVENEVLISHASANFREIKHRDCSYIVGGLSTVMTYPAYRGTGCASQVVRAATDHLCASAADIAMLFCGQPLRKFYESAGWEPSEQAQIYFGDESRPTLKSDNLVMMLFISEKGRAARTFFQNEPVYVGAQTW